MDAMPIRGVPLEIPPAMVRDQVARICAHPLFVRSARVRRFLSFTVEHSLAGAADELKEYVIGCAVFDRLPLYDPRVDPIVRVEARRVREKLRSYYASAGKRDLVILEYPVGSYAPVFRLRQSSAGAALAVSVLPFAAPVSSEAFGEGLRREIIAELARTCGIRLAAPGQADGLLTGVVLETRGRVRVVMQLLEPARLMPSWSDCFDSGPADAKVLQKQIAFSTVHGIIAYLNGSAGEAVA